MNKDVVDLVESLGGTVLFGGMLIQFTDTTFMAALKKIYESGALEEREACANVCDAYSKESSNPMNFSNNCANAIRARGQA
jgi:hypothetical protein